MKAVEERDVAHAGTKTCSFRVDDIKNSAEFRAAYEHAVNVIGAEDQPFEQSPDGLVKHLVHEKMGTRESCVDAYQWDWETEPKKFEWTRGDFIYIPPFSIHQHFNPGKVEARLIVISNRIVKAMGFNWLDQVENAPGV